MAKLVKAHKDSVAAVLAEHSGTHVLVCVVPDGPVRELYLEERRTDPRRTEEPWGRGGVPAGSQAGGDDTPVGHL